MHFVHLYCCSYRSYFYIVFTTAKTVPSGQPVLTATTTNVEVKYSENQVVRAASGTIGKAYIAMQALGRFMYSKY